MSIVSKHPHALSQIDAFGQEPDAALLSIGCSFNLCSPWLGCSVTLGKKYIFIGHDGPTGGAQNQQSKTSMPLNSLVVRLLPSQFEKHCPPTSVPGSRKQAWGKLARKAILQAKNVVLQPACRHDIPSALVWGPLQAIPFHRSGFHFHCWPGPQKPLVAQYLGPNASVFGYFDPVGEVFAGWSWPDLGKEPFGLAKSRLAAVPGLFQCPNFVMITTSCP